MVEGTQYAYYNLEDGTHIYASCKIGMAPGFCAEVYMSEFRWNVKGYHTTRGDAISVKDQAAAALAFVSSALKHGAAWGTYLILSDIQGKGMIKHLAPYLPEKFFVEWHHARTYKKDRLPIPKDGSGVYWYKGLDITSKLEEPFKNRNSEYVVQKMVLHIKDVPYAEGEYEQIASDMAARREAQSRERANREENRPEVQATNATDRADAIRTRDQAIFENLWQRYMDAATAQREPFGLYRGPRRSIVGSQVMNSEGVVQNVHTETSAQTQQQEVGSQAEGETNGIPTLQANQQQVHQAISEQFGG